jgi:hypothetical protein
LPPNQTNCNWIDIYSDEELVDGGGVIVSFCMGFSVVVVRVELITKPAGNFSPEA